MSTRRRPPLTARGFGALLIGVLLVIAANAVAAPILLYVAMLLFLLTALSALVVHAPRRSGTVARQISTDLLTVGEQSQVVLRFTLRSLRAPHGVWRDALPDAVTGDATGEYTPESDLIRYPITGVRRGVWPLGPLVLRTTDPFGLAQREQTFGEVRTVTVAPQLVALAPLAARLGASGGTAQLTSSRLGPGSDNLSPRPYVTGDSMRRIHWRATAHRGELMVRQEEEEASPDAIVVIDRADGRFARPGDAADPLFETAVSACASAALHLAGEGYGVDVVDSAGNVIGALRGHEDERDELLVALARLQPQGHADDLAAALRGASPGPLVVITGRVDEERARMLSTSGASVPVLLSTSPEGAALAAASSRGWSAARLTEDVAASWADALADRLVAGGGDVPH
ncbi:DUF58 domain-containing protein [Microbacterium sp. NPDC055903]